MVPNMNEELWRVQLSTGEIRMMTLDGLDRAFEEGLIDARVPVLPPGASAWTTLGEAAGLDDEPKAEQTPSLSPVAIAAPSSAAAPGFEAPSGALLDLDLPDTFDELKPRRRGLVIGAAASVAAVAVMFAVVAARLGASMPTTTEVNATTVKATTVVQAPPPAVEALPAAEPAKKEVKEDAKPELSDWQKRMLVDADKAREEKARAKKQEKAEKAVRSQPKRQQKASSGLLNGGDKFDPLNGAL
jgi:hypothetical protein